MISQRVGQELALPDLARIICTVVLSRSGAGAPFFGGGYVSSLFIAIAAEWAFSNFGGGFAGTSAVGRM
jgi:hypothetical protein